MGKVFSFWINIISKCFNFIFELKINENPDITIGSFLLACAFIGVVIYFILGTDFLSSFSISKSSNSTNNTNNGYQPKHAKK